jgi:hypothetical protein
MDKEVSVCAGKQAILEAVHSASSSTSAWLSLNKQVRLAFVNRTLRNCWEWSS